MKSRRGYPLTLLSAQVPLAPVDLGMPVTFKYGFSDAVEWQGTLEYAVKGGDLMGVSVAGADELALLQTRCRESFIDETAEAIIRSVLATTGLAVAQIDAPGAVIPRFTAPDIPVWQAVHRIEDSLRTGFGLTGYALWLGCDGLRWTTGSEPGDIPVIETGTNLIDHAPCDVGLSKVTTFMLPGFAHSRQFKLKDTRRGIEGTFRALQVEHSLVECHARTCIYYQEES